MTPAAADPSEPSSSERRALEPAWILAWAACWLAPFALFVLVLVPAGFGMFGRSWVGGAFYLTTALGGLAIDATLGATGLDRKLVGHVIMGMASHSHRDSIYAAQGMAWRGGLDDDVPALTVARICGSGAEAVAVGMEHILAGVRHDKQRPFLVVGGIAGLFAFRKYYATYGGRRVVDKILLKMPVMGVLFQKIAVAKFCRTLSTLIASGVPILDGLEITAKTAGNAIIEDGILAVRKSVEEGKTISEPLQETGVFPDMVCQMISIGEQTGALDTMLSKIADFYEDEVDEATQNLLSLLEPLIIVFLGTVIGGIVISMYMPMFSLIGKIG